MLKLVDTHCVNLLHYLISGFFKKYFNYKEDIIQIFATLTLVSPIDLSGRMAAGPVVRQQNPFSFSMSTMVLLLDSVNHPYHCHVTVLSLVLTENVKKRTIR